MRHLSFGVTGVRAEPYAAVPTLVFDLGIETSSAEPVESIALRCQIRIEPHKRQYGRGEEERLEELFGAPPRWGDTLKPFLWTHVSTVIPGFSGKTSVALPVACSYDLEVAAGKYFHALEGGEIPTIFLFSGTIFVRGAQGLRVEQIPWDKESSFRLPIAVWRELMDAYFPQSGWLRLHRDTLNRLGRLKARRALPTWDDVVNELLRKAELEEAS